MIHEHLKEANQRIEDSGFRNNYKKAVEKINEILGEEPFKKRNHPLRSKLINWAEWSNRWVMRFAKMIGSFESDEVFQKEIIPRLKSRSEYVSAYFELKTAYKIRKREKEVKFLQRKGNQKTPDLIIESILPLECKVLYTPQHIAEQNKRCDEISQVLLYHKLRKNSRCSGIIYRPISEKEKDEIIKQVKGAIPRAEKGEIVKIKGPEMEIPTPTRNDYEILLVPEERKEFLEKWRSKRGLDATFSGPPLTKNEKNRVRREIRKKTRQIPENMTGALLIKVDLWPPRDRKEEFLGFMEDLQKNVYDQEKLTSLIIEIGGPFSKGNEIQYADDNFRIFDRLEEDLLESESFLIIHNRFANEVNKKEIVDQIFGA